MTTMNQNPQAQLACLEQHNLAQLFTEQITDTSVLFGEFATEDLMNVIRSTVAPDFQQRTAGATAFTFLEKALFLGLSFEEQSDALVQLATILHNTNNLFFGKDQLNLVLAPGYFGELMRSYAELPSMDDMARFEEARFALKLLSATFHRYELLTMNINARIEAADAWSQELAQAHGDFNTYTEIVFDYYDNCYSIIETFLAATSELKKAEAVSFLTQLNAEDNSLSGLQILEFLLSSHILSLHEATETTECPALNDAVSNKLAFTVLAGSKTLLANGQDLNLVMDFAEKALLFAKEKELIDSVLAHMNGIMELAQELPGSLAQLMVPYVQLADTVAQCDESCKLELSFLTAELGGLESVLKKVRSLQTLMEALKSKSSAESYPATLYAYYDDSAQRLAQLQEPLYAWSTYR